MTIQVKNILTKTRNPSEHNMKLENKVGEIIQVVGDGYCLIEFNDLKHPGMTKYAGYGAKKLQWYVHENDFFIKL